LEQVMISLQVFYEGHVQGVGFRFTVRHIAKGFDVTGWVRNLPDGRVELQV
jgi:acylphosphatase